VDFGDRAKEPRSRSFGDRAKEPRSRSFDAMPVAPAGEGLFGHNTAFRKDRMGTLRKIALSNEPMMRLRLPFPGIRAACANDPDIVQEVLVENAKNFEKSDMLRFSLRNLAGEGLFTSNGELWKKQRKIMAPLFQPKALEAYASDMVACAERTVAGWKDGEELELARETTRLTMGIAGKTLFDADTFSEADEIGHALTIALAWTGWVVGRPFAIGHVVTKRALEKLAERTKGPARVALARGARRFQGPVALVGRRGRELAQAIKFLDEHVQSMIDERRTSHGLPRQDLMSRLLAARDDEGRAMSDRQVRDEVLTLFVAGHETTATGLAWTLYEVCKNREIYAAMVREADAVGDAPTAADLPKLDLCLRAFKEALRMYPPVYVFGRDSRHDVNIGGYDLPAPTNILTSPWVLHHSARLYPDPERFDPDRFLPVAEAARHRYAYLPFGAGPRICLGNHFAYLEAALGLAVLLRRFEFEVLGEDQPEPSATLRPKYGIKVRVKKRR
jgi:cytochrome P450